MTTSVVETRWRSGLGNLGPFLASYTVQATPGTGVASTASSSSRFGRQALDLELHLSFEIDLGAILPELWLPLASITTLDGAHVETPRTQVAWPTVTIRLLHRDCVIATHEPITNSASMLAAIALAVTDAIVEVPFGSLVLAVALDRVLASVGVDGVNDFLQSIVASLTASPGAVVPAMDSAAVAGRAAHRVDTIPDDYSGESQHVLAEPAWA